jgi:hypothetical protein
MDNDATQRNNKIYELLSSYLKDSQPKVIFNEPFQEDEVEALFTTPIWGHRELVLTVLLTRLVYPDYKATDDLYKHHPRSVYEKPVRLAFREHGIPHKKSGPLNVAKNIRKLNMDWATDKNDERVAVSAVKIVEKIEQVSKSELESFAAAYISRYKQEATRIKDMEVKLAPQENPIFIAELCNDLINNVPDGGATAQFIVGSLMEMSNAARQSEVAVNGHLDSVSATNTTSKKPGDVIEALSDKTELVYEITTKAFNDDRLMESHEAVSVYSEDIADVFVICRPADVPDALETTPTAYLMASTQYQQLSYYFVNIYQYIQSELLFVPTDARKDFYETLVAYVNDTNRAEKVKIYFSDWHKTKD